MSKRTITIDKDSFYEVDNPDFTVLNKEGLLFKLLFKANQMGLNKERLDRARIRRDDLKREVYVDLNYSVGNWGIPDKR